MLRIFKLVFCAAVAVDTLFDEYWFECGKSKHDACGQKAVNYCDTHLGYMSPVSIDLMFRNQTN